MGKHNKLLILEDFLPYRLSLLSNTISSQIAATYQDKFGITMPEWRIMAVLAEYPGIAADDVCQRTRIEKSVVSRAVARLLNRHLLVREFHQQDKRRSILRLSDTGLSVYAEVVPVAERFEDMLLSGLDPSEKKQLSGLLAKLQSRADSLEEI